MNSDVEEIKQRINIVDLISSYLTLKKAGVNYRAVCPFHNEKTPSLMVSPEKQIWHCFGCSEGGDVFTFVMKMENLEFPEALKMLADRAGIRLERKKISEFESNNQLKKSRLYELNNLSARAYHKILTSHPLGKMALEYLKERKLTNSIIKEFMLGYAPSSRAMLGFFKKHGFSDAELEAAGNPQKFFKRIIFPIRDALKNVIAFTGRVTEKGQEPKYLNTPETIIFHKSRVLYNLEKARGAIKTENATVVVEGQMDVIAAWQAGTRNVVATSGTALTPDHLQILYRYSPNIIFSFDFDTAGLKSAKKALEMAIVEGFNVKMVDLSFEGEIFKDPGEMIAKNPKLWLERVEKAQAVIDWYFQLAFGKRLTANGDKEMTAQEKKEIAKEILPILKKIPDKIEQAHYVSLLANRLAVADQVIFDALEKPASPAGRLEDIKENREKKIEKREKKRVTSEELLLAILLKKPEKIGTVQAKIKESGFKDSALSAIYKSLIEWYIKNKDKGDKKDLVKDLRENLDRSLQLKMDELLFIGENEEEEELNADLVQTCQNLQTSKREELKNYYAKEIKAAENNKDLERLKKLIKEFQNAISK